MKRSFILFCILMVWRCSAIAQTYKIGDLYTAPDGSQGVVFYLHPDGSGGWVVALNDASTNCAWGEAVDVPGLVNRKPASVYYQQLLSDTAGYSSTQILYAYQNYNTNFTAGVIDYANGWYLPSPGQLRILYGYLPIIDSAILQAGGTTMKNFCYWTSTERDATTAWWVSFVNGSISFSNKPASRWVRAVRSFSYPEENPEPDLSYFWSTGDTTSSITVNPMQTTTYTVTVSAPSGCADTVEHTIVVGVSSNEEINQFACDSFEWNGQTYTQSGDYTFTYPMSSGCDSVVILHLTVDHTPQATISVSVDTICEGNDVTLQASAVSGTPVYYVPTVAVGDILCTDNSIVKPADWPVAGKTAMGIVFHVDNTGEHGWAVHLHDQFGAQWTPNNQQIDILTLTNYTNNRDAIMDLDGYSNTQKIRAAGNASMYPAAYAVDFVNGWYIPAAGQLRLLYGEFVTLNASLQIVDGIQFPMDHQNYYWSSTEYGQNSVWYLADLGSMSYVPKYYNNIIRSVRNF